MVEITKAEMEYLQKKGCVFGEELHHTWGKNRTYYMTESPKLLNVLNTYRKKQIIK